MDFLHSRLHKTFAKAIVNEDPITSREMIANVAVMEAVFASAWRVNAYLTPT
jgi:hypothetical protein